MTHSSVPADTSRARENLCKSSYTLWSGSFGVPTAHLVPYPTGCSLDEWNSSLNIKYLSNGVSQCIVSEEFSFQLHEKFLVFIWRKKKCHLSHTLCIMYRQVTEDGIEL